MLNLDEKILELLNLLKHKKYLEVEEKSLEVLKYYKNNLKIIICL